MKSTSSIIMILVAIGVFYTFIDPQYQEVKALRAEALEYKGVLDDANAIARKVDQLLVEYQNIPEANIDRLEKALPDNVDAVQLALDLDSIASNYGISIKEVSVAESGGGSTGPIGGDETGLPYGKSSVAFSFISNYQNLRAFLADVERSLRIIDIRSLGFSAVEGDVYEHQVVIETYWLK